jgi:hypothetical protein
MAEKSTSSRELVRYQLQWRPSFPSNRNGGHRMYVIGEKKKYTGENENELSLRAPDESQDPNTFSIQEIARVAFNSTLIIPFNTGIALAQEYSPMIRNKLVEYRTLGGNSVTTFGQDIKRVGLKIKIIKAGRLWETYVKGLESMQYLSANQGRFYGGLYLIGYDMFADGSHNVAGRYKVVIDSLEFQHRSDHNTTVNADLQMLVTHDYGHSFEFGKHDVWGAL